MRDCGDEDVGGDGEKDVNGICSVESSCNSMHTLCATNGEDAEDTNEAYTCIKRFSYQRNSFRYLILISMCLFFSSICRLLVGVLHCAGCAF